MSNDKLHGLKFEARENPGFAWWVYAVGEDGTDLPIHRTGLLEQPARNLAAMLNAAPATLEACEAALSLLTDDGRQGGKTWTENSLRAAIAAATGEPK